MVKTAVKRARDSGAEARAGLLERVRTVGAAALTESTFVRSMLLTGGEAQGGVLTAADLTSVRDMDVAATTVDTGGQHLLVPPWGAEEVTVTEELGRGHAVCAVDVKGLFAVLCYRRVASGVSVDDLEVEAPAIAEPVLRGITRVAPGAPLPAPSPVAIVLDANGKPIEVVAAPGEKRLDAEALASAKLRIKWDATGNRPVHPKL